MKIKMLKIISNFSLQRLAANANFPRLGEIVTSEWRCLRSGLSPTVSNLRWTTGKQKMFAHQSRRSIIWMDRWSTCDKVPPKIGWRKNNWTSRDELSTKWKLIQLLLGQRNIKNFGVINLNYFSKKIREIKFKS